MVDGSDLAGAADDGLLAVGAVDDGNLAAFFEVRGVGMEERWQRQKRARAAKISHMRFYRGKRLITPETRCWKPLVRRTLSPCHGDGFGGAALRGVECATYFTRHMWPDVASGAFVRARAPPRLTHHHPRPSFITDSLAAL